MLGIGNGQPNRLESLRISMRKAEEEVKGASLASDALFPIAWNDTVEKVCEASIVVVAEHGDSIRNKDTIECYNSI
jgi:phosphoribosylaminoimidazolecarboxamide formyltransferase/IMP cyclohydrolase